MVYNVLFLAKELDDIRPVGEILKSKLLDEKVSFNIELASKLEDKLELLEKNYFNLILSEFELLASQNFYIFTMELNSKIYSLKYDYQTDVSYEETILRGALPLITEKDNKEKIAQILLPKIEELKYCDSYTNLLIESMVELESAEDLANMMIGYGKSICKQYDIKGIDRSDMLRVLSILAVSLKKRSLIKTIRFFERMRVAEKIVDLLHKFLEPYTQEGYIIHTIYKHVQIELSEDKTHTKCCNSDVPTQIHDDVVEVIRLHKVFIEQGSDLEQIWIRVIDALNKSDAKEDSYDSFVRASMKLARYAVCYKRGGLTSLDNNNGSLTFSIKCRERMEEGEIGAVFKDKIAFDESLVFELDENYAKLSLDTEIKESIIPPKTKEKEQLKPLHSHERVYISAKEYVNNLDNLEDLQDIIEVLEDYEDMAERIISSNEGLHIGLLMEASEITSKFSTFLALQKEFKDLSYVLATLTSILKNANEENVAKARDKIYIILVSIIDDLRSWKKNIFIEKISRDIHYLDDSLYSSCLQLERLLNGECEECGSDDDDELELF